MLFYITLIVNGFTASTLQFPCELAFLEAIEAQESAGWNWVSSESHANGGATAVLEQIVGDDKYRWTRDGIN